MRTPYLLCLLLVVVPGRAATAGPQQQPPRPDPTALAPDGEWPMQDGCPARTRATPTRGPAGDLEVAWKWVADQPVTGDPCVVGERVYVAGAADANGMARVAVLRLSDGGLLGSTFVPAREGPVRIAAHRDMVVVTEGGYGVRVLRPTGDGTKLATLAEFGGRFDPVVIGGDVLTVGDGPSSSEGSVRTRCAGSGASAARPSGRRRCGTGRCTW